MDDAWNVCFIGHRSFALRIAVSFEGSKSGRLKFLNFG